MIFIIHSTPSFALPLWKIIKAMNTETAIKNIMTSRIIFVGRKDTLLKVENIFEEFSIHHVLVVEDSRLYGIISKNDILKIYQKHAAQNNIPNRAQILVSDFMTKDPICLDITDTIGLAADIFLSNKIHSLPVLNGDILAGIVTNHDIIKFCFR